MTVSSRNLLICFGIALLATSAGAQRSARLQTDGKVAEFPLPQPNSGPTTVSIAPDGTLWFTESAGNRIGRMAQDGSGLKEFDLPHPGSAPCAGNTGSPPPGEAIAHASPRSMPGRPSSFCLESSRCSGSRRAPTVD